MIYYSVAMNILLLLLDSLQMVFRMELLMKK